MAATGNYDHRRVPKLTDEAIWEMWKDSFMTFAMLEDGASRQHPGVSVATFVEAEVAYRARPDPEGNDSNRDRRLDKARREWKDHRLACLRCFAFLFLCSRLSK